jgi:hypothetical protein
VNSRLHCARKKLCHLNYLGASFEGDGVGLGEELPQSVLRSIGLPVDRQTPPPKLQHPILRNAGFGIEGHLAGEVERRAGIRNLDYEKQFVSTRMTLIVLGFVLAQN